MMRPRSPNRGAEASGSELSRPGWLSRFVDSTAYRVLSIRLQDLLFHVLPDRWREYNKAFQTMDVPAPYDRKTPEGLLTVPGIRRDPELEKAAAADDPLTGLFDKWPEVQEHLHRGMWRNFLRVGPMMLRINRRIQREHQQAVRSKTGPAQLEADPEALTRQVFAHARDLGISLTGVAKYDERYHFVAHKADLLGDRVVVCFSEQDHEATQTAPSLLATTAAFTSSAAAVRLAGELAKYLRELGYSARVLGQYETGIVIHYAVEAGLGQLGMNGQLLAPQFGSRCHPATITTNAPLTFGKPVDFGITKICDECRLCALRCPPGAIPARRRMYRGVEKAKIDPRRCGPVVGAAHGCAVCTKVCPIQRFGLAAVHDHWEKTGKILGKGSDDLEGYWFDGVYYGANHRPRLDDTWLELKPHVYSLPPADRTN